MNCQTLLVLTVQKDVYLVEVQDTVKNAIPDTTSGALEFIMVYSFNNAIVVLPTASTVPRPPPVSIVTKDTKSTAVLYVKFQQ